MIRVRAIRRSLIPVLCLLGLMVVSACSPQPAQVAQEPTLSGVVLPTREQRSPTPSPTASPSPTPTETPDLAATAAFEQTATQAELLNQATLSAAASATAQAVQEATETAIFQTAEARVSATAVAALATSHAAQTSTAEAVTVTFTPSPTETPSATPTATETPTATAEPTPAPSPADTPIVQGERFADSTSFYSLVIQPPVELSVPVSGSLSHEQFAMLFPFDGAQGQVIDASLTRTSGNLDPILLIIDEKGRELARDNNVTAGAEMTEIRGLELPESGRYFVMAGRFGGVAGLSEGGFQLTLSEGSADQPQVGAFSNAIVYESIVSGSISAAQEQQVYTFRGTAGDVISIQMLRATGDLDSRIYLYDNVGNVLTWNDDDMLSYTIDSYVEGYVLPFDGYYSLVATRYFGAPNSGDFRLKVSLDQPGARGVDHPYVAALDHVSSRTLRDDGNFYTNFAAGDSFVNGTELRMQSLISFWLPIPRDENFTVTQARLTLEPCHESGSGFATLGELTVYADTYGRLDGSRSYIRPSAGARILTTTTDCTTAIDVTDYIQQLYSDGDPMAQFRLAFRNSQTNGSGDDVLFTPNLTIEYAAP